jgi:tetratricopeptide (TPR) repeat protein
MVSFGFSVARHACATLVVAAFGLSVTPAFAIDSEPKPKIDCSNPKNKDKPACKDHHGPAAADDEIVNGAYWLAHAGQYAEALKLLGTVANKENPRVLSAIGFATRKLGDVDAALPYYARALAINPDYVQAREYLGEAFLTKGDLTRASEQLGEIERRCGTGCVAFVALKQQITAYEQASRS